MSQSKTSARGGRNQKFRKGFTLVEAVVATGVIAVGFAGVLILLASNARQAENIRNAVIASRLAEEGIEVVRNVRDTNWLDSANPSWRDGLDDTVAGLVDHDGVSVSENSDNASWCLNWSGTFYEHLATLPYNCNTSFKRHIEIRTLQDDFNMPEDPVVDFLEVRSVVEWKSREGQTRAVTVVDHLYDWR